MRLQNLAATALIASLAVSAAGVAWAQDYPNKPLRIITTPAGGGNDFLTRLVAAGITGGLGQNVVVDNRPANVAGETAVKATPNGYTMIITGNFLWVSPLLSRKPAYDAVRDLAPISLLATSPNVIVVHPSVGASSTKELIALAKAKPGVLNYGMTGTGTANHTAAELFKSMAGVEIVSVGYKGTGAATTDLLAGRVQVMFASVQSVIPHIKSGRLKALAVTGSAQSALLPELPTVAASGVPGYEAQSIFGAFAPAGTPGAVINRLNREIVQYLKTAEARERLLSVGMEVVGSSPAQLAEVVKSETLRLGKLIRATGMRRN
ncbi:MAG: tripartite tricarboxylate transporter substrate-binding protein [Burkholderiales bacterium]|nr:tripartite tricarboxylate transporter substrate-binding protein [Burkholderiales bacterium]